VKKKELSILFGIILAGFVLVVGCNPPAETGEDTPANGNEESSTDSAGGGSGEADHSDMKMEGSTEVAEALQELPPEERKIALEQEICPISGAKLGSMGKPIKMTHQGETVFLCCQGCEATFKEDPDKYLAKISD
jgi:Cu(I)/Ag(I) efflux system membrane fusion protein